MCDACLYESQIMANKGEHRDGFLGALWLIIKTIKHYWAQCLAW